MSGWESGEAPKALPAGRRVPSLASVAGAYLMLVGFVVLRALLRAT